MQTKITNFLSNIPRPDFLAKPTPKDSTKFTQVSTKVTPEKVKKFFSDHNLSVSLRLFSNQISDCTQDILKSPLPNEEKIATLKTAIVQLEQAVEGRRNLMQKVSVLEESKYLVLHGKTRTSLEKNLHVAEEQIQRLKAQVADLEMKGKTKGKPLPAPPPNFRFDPDSFAAHLLNPRFPAETRDLMPLFAPVFGVKNASSALQKAFEKKVAAAADKQAARLEARAFVSEFLKTIPYDELSKHGAVLASLINSLYVKGEDPKKDFLMQQWDELAIDIQLGEITLSTTRPVTDLQKKLIHLAEEKNPKKYEKVLNEVTLALHDDTLDLLAALKDSDVFNPSKSRAGGGTYVRGLEDTLRLYLSDTSITPNERSRRAEVLLDISKKHFENKNLLMGIVFLNLIYSRTTLESIPVSKKHLAFKNEMALLLDPVRNNKTYFDYTAKLTQPYIPFLSYNLRRIADLQENTENIPNYANLRKLSELRNQHFAPRAFALSTGRLSPYSFIDQHRVEKITAETRRLALTEGYKGKDELEDYQAFLFSRVRAETKARGEPKA